MNFTAIDPFDLPIGARWVRSWNPNTGDSEDVDVPVGLTDWDDLVSAVLDGDLHAGEVFEVTATANENGEGAESRRIVRYDARGWSAC